MDKISNEDLQIYINSKGLDRCIQYTIDYKMIEDKAMAKKWKKGKIILDDIEKTLKEKIIGAIDVFTDI